MRRTLALVLLSLMLSVSNLSWAQTQPRVQRIAPSVDVSIPENAVFALKLNRPLTTAPKALCDVWGVRSAVPTQTIEEPQRTAVLKAYGLGQEANDTKWVVLRCQMNLPGGANATVRWLNPDRVNAQDNDTGENNWQGQYFTYRVYSDLPLSIECSRVNAESGCNPLDPVRIVFTQGVQTADVKDLVFKDSKGKIYRNDLPNESKLSITQQVQYPKLPLNETLTLQWPNRLTNEKGQPLLNAAARSKTLTVRMGTYPPLVKFGATFGIAEKAIGGVVPLSVRSIEASPEAGKVKLRQLKLNDEVSIIEAMNTLQRVTQADGAKNPDYQDYQHYEDSEYSASPQKLKQLRYPFAFPKAKQPFADTRSISWLKPFKTATLQDLPKQLDGDAFEVLGIPLPSAGLYLLEAESVQLGKALLDRNQPMYVRSGALVTDLGVHLQLAKSLASVWVTQLSTGKPVADAAISLYDCKGKRLAQGNGNADGFVVLDLKPDSHGWGCPLFAFAKKQDDLSFVQSNWQNGIQSWRFSTVKNIYHYDSNQIIHTVLARNLLKGGEVLHAKHFWRVFNNRGEMVVPRKADLPTQLQLIHQGSGERTTLPVSWDSRANATTSYTLPLGMKRGTYTIAFNATNCEQCGNTTFRVEEFRLPVLKAEVVADKKPSFVGDNIQTQLRLSYLSGGAAAGEKVAVSQRLLQHTPYFSDYTMFNFSYYDDNNYEENTDEADLNTLVDDTANLANKQAGEDASHTLSPQGTLTVSNRIPRSNGQVKALLTEMQYRDPNGETYRAQGRTTVWPAAVILGSKVEHWASGKARKVDFIALSPEGKPMPNVAIEVQGAFQGYVTHRNKTTGGYYSYRYERITEKFTKLCAGQSNAQGLYTCEYTPKMTELDSGEFAIQGIATDSQGRTSIVKTMTWIYNGEEVWFSQGDHDRMDVLTDTPKVKMGDTATIQVRSPFREATAWVNVLRSGAVIDTLVVPLSGKNPSFKLPIKANYEPNVFINVLAVRGRVAQPAPTALVDLARPAFKVGILQLDVASPAHELKVNVTTDKQIYQSRTIATAAITVSPPTGRALPADSEVAVFAIDEALLELMPNTTWNVLQPMFAQRGYGFETASANMQVLGKRHYGRKALPAGGGGGKSAARELFDTLLVWQGSVKLDASGQAKVTIPVNDSLTRFKVVVVANAGVDMFGTGSASFVATKDLQILSGLPQTAREGDQFSAGFTLRNTSKKAMQVTVKAQANDTPLAPQTIDIPADQAKAVSWTLTVPQNNQNIVWRIEASSDTQAQDSLVIKQTVGSPLLALRYAIGSGDLAPNQAAAFGATPSSTSMKGKGEVMVSLSPAFAVDASGIRDYMKSYPFYCLEQRTSKAITLRDKALWNIIYNTLEQYVTESGLVNYYPDQFGYDGGYDVLTSFLLSSAHEAQFKLPVALQERMLDGLSNFITGKIERKFIYSPDAEYDLTERKLLALEALARYTTVPATMTDSLRLQASDLPRLSNRAIVQWLDVLNRVNWSNKAALKTLAIAQLQSRLKPDAGGSLRLIPTAKDLQWHYMYSAEANAARLALLALDTPELKPQATALAAGAINTQRPGDYWWQTQANVWGSLMLDRRAALSATGVTGNTQINADKTVINHDWAKSPEGGQYTLPSQLLTQINTVHTGTGKPYINVRGLSWAALTAARLNNANVSKTIKPLKQAKPGVYTAGDVLEVQLKFNVKDNMGWLALTDPIPTGATILGGGLKGLGSVATQEKKGRKNPDQSYEAYPSYIENTATAVRVYYEYLWGDTQSDFTYTYQLRINNAGVFNLPPTQLEAMYHPDYYAYKPNPVMVVK